MAKIVDSYDKDFDDVNVLIRLKRVIFSHNMTQLSLLLQTMTKKEKHFVLKHKEQLSQLLKENQWKKGLKLFNLAIKRHEPKYLN